MQWEVAHDEAFARPVRRGQAQALPELAHAVHVEVPGLAPDRVYFYRFMSGDAVSPVGRTRTLPAPDAPTQRLRLAHASCQRWEHGFYSAWRHMRADAPDFVLFLGDYIYEYPNAVGAVRSPGGGWTVTLDDYRRRHALHKSDADLQAMHAACPWFVTWDDHEVQNDYAGLTPGDGGPAVADFAARRAAAYQAFYEHMPLRASVLTRALVGLSSGAEMRIYGQVPFGRLATLYLLDDRQYRDRQACTRNGRFGSGMVNPERCDSWNDPQRTLLGAAQEQWLDQALAQAAGGATWNVLGQQTLFGQRDFRPGPGFTLWNDGWDGYGPARTCLTDALQRHRGVLGEEREGLLVVLAEVGPVAAIGDVERAHADPAVAQRQGEQAREPRVPRREALEARVGGEVVQADGPVAGGRGREQADLAAGGQVMAGEAGHGDSEDQGYGRVFDRARGRAWRFRPMSPCARPGAARAAPWHPARRGRPAAAPGSAAPARCWPAPGC